MSPWPPPQQSNGWLFEGSSYLTFMLHSTVLAVSFYLISSHWNKTVPWCFWPFLHLAPWVLCSLFISSVIFLCFLVNFGYLEIEHNSTSYSKMKTSPVAYLALKSYFPSRMGIKDFQWNPPEPGLNWVRGRIGSPLKSTVWQSGEVNFGSVTVNSTRCEL